MKPIYFLLIAGLIAIIAGFVYFAPQMGGHVEIRDILDYIGVTVTVFSLTLASYFVVLAVSAYGHVRQIEQAKDFITKTQADTEERGRAFEKYIAQSSAVIEEYITAVGAADSEEYVSRLHLVRQRYAFHQSRDEADRLRILRDLISHGKADDLRTAKEFLRGRRDSESRSLLREVDQRLTAPRPAT